MKWAECLPGYRHLHCSEFKWYVRGKNKIKASCIFKKRKLGHPAQMLNLFSFFFPLEKALCLLSWEEQLSVLHHPSSSPASSEGSEFDWGRSYANVYELCLLLTSCFSSLLPTPSWQTPKGRLLPEPVVLLPQHSGGVHRGEGPWALPFSPGMGRAAGTLGNRAAWGEAAQATGGMFSSCPLQGLLRLVWLFFQIFVCRSMM